MVLQPDPAWAYYHYKKTIGFPKAFSAPPLIYWFVKTPQGVIQLRHYSDSRTSFPAGSVWVNSYHEVTTSSLSFGVIMGGSPGFSLLDGSVHFYYAVLQR